LKKFLGAGGSSAFAAVALLTVGGSGQALAQTMQNLPVVRAVVSTAATPAAAPVANVANAARAASSVAAALPLAALVAANSVGAELDEQGKCLAAAVYFESMGEPLEGQLAVANVVINRARSGRYPSSWCGVVKQKAQFSFVRGGRFPRIDTNSDAWSKAQAIARIAALNLTTALPQDVLWYHADYVSPSWGRRLNRASKIGAHIFYRA
jgi:spore germination cell wall hydrolase CwlJ-like protein